VAVRGCGELIAAGTENQVDLIMGRQKPLSLSVGFEPPEYLFPFAGLPVRHFDNVVESFVGAMVTVRGQCFDRLDVAAQFVSDNDPGFAKPGYQSLEKPPCRFGIPARLHKNIKNISTCVDGAPQPVPLATDRDYDFIHVPLVVRAWSIPADAICKMSTKAIGPQPDRLPADNDAPRSQQVFNISRAQS
jgi:hypothetical protein